MLIKLGKKNDFLEAKAKQQIETILPQQLREQARNTLAACSDVRKF